MQNEARFRTVERLDSKRFRQLVEAAERYAAQHTSVYEQLAKLIVPTGAPAAAAGDEANAEQGSAGQGGADLAREVS
jgi:hypothetical protein